MKKVHKEIRDIKRKNKVLSILDSDLQEKYNTDPIEALLIQLITEIKKLK